MKHSFIINPAAGKGKALSYISQIEAYFSQRNEEYSILVTEGPGHATEIARMQVSRRVERIYSVGGDGTLNEVLNGMAGSQSSLGIIPSGSGNDFIKSIRNPVNLQNILSETIEGEEMHIDLGRLNDRYFVNIASMGFDAEVVHNARRFKRIPGVSGSFAYVLGIIFTAFSYRGNLLDLVIDGQRMNMNTLLVAIANGKYYGGGMMPAPEAIIDDGEFEICTIKNLNILKILSCFPKLMKGTHGEIKEVSFHTGKSVAIRCRNPVVMNIDGEILISREAVFEIIPKGVKIITPRIKAPIKTPAANY
ncbi:MAG: diacylglycerol kinase family lipid kinase [Clostridia bacterium]|nr:diacylglycerol kinase family lipid kinase [Clostridia bacterium]